MITPTVRLIAVAAGGAVVAAAVAAVSEPLWLIGPVWILAVLLAGLFDTLLAASTRSVEVTPHLPAWLGVGAPAEAALDVRFPARAPRWVEGAVEADPRAGLSPGTVRAPVGRQGARLAFSLTPIRRGAAGFTRAWLRWRGPLGLVALQREVDLPDAGLIGVNTRKVRDDALRLFARDSDFGAKAQRELGEGAEYHALRDFQVGMDVRAIDWKASARHGALLAKEFRTERNHQIMVAIDCGRVMSEPVEGQPRVDRALTAGLLLAYAALRSGDRAALYAFDSRPRVVSGQISSVTGFAALERIAARVDYSAEETNFALGLTQLAATLRRRSLVVVFTEFADSTAAELMLESVGRLLSNHLVLFVVLRDDELEGLIDAEPHTPEDVSRAVVAAGLARERDLVLAKLKRLGVHIVEAPIAHLGPAVVDAYLDLKRRDLL